MSEITSMTAAAAESQALTARLAQSRLFRDYQSAFESATALPLHLQPITEATGGLISRPTANAFCRLMAKQKQTCAACHALQQKLELPDGPKARSLECYAGLFESAMPILAGDRPIAHLRTGQILLQRPDAAQFKKVKEALRESGVTQGLQEIEAAWFSSTVLKESQYQSILRLLDIFAGHLSAYANVLIHEIQNAEPATITNAKAWVQAKLNRQLSLPEVAKAVNVSAPYLSGLFRRVTGLTFTGYLARVRVEMVKSLLANPQLRITEIAYGTGFNSLSQFNRVFKRMCGVSPREYRAASAAGLLAQE